MKIQRVTHGGLVLRDATPEELAQAQSDKTEASKEKVQEDAKQLRRKQAIRDTPGNAPVTRAEFNALKSMLREYLNL